MGLIHHHHHHHSHSHEKGHSHDHGTQEVPRALSGAMVITIIFMLVEVIGGYLSNSLALISDAAHMLTDVGALLLGLFAFWMAKKPTTPKMSFGYHRVEILGALASGLVIWLISGLLVYEAFARLSSPPEVNGPIVSVIAAIGLAANLLSMLMLKKTKDENINVRAAYIHLFADSLGSVGALVAGLILWWTGWRPIDPIVTILFAALMLWSSWSLVKESVGVLMESVPVGIDSTQVKNDLQRIPGVREAHDLHIWSVSAGKLALSVHLVSDEAEQVLSKANGLLEEQYGIHHTTIQIEHPDKFESERCYDCS